MDHGVSTLCVNIFDKLANSSDFEISALESMVKDVKKKLADAKERLEVLENKQQLVPIEVKPLSVVHDDCNVESLALNCFLNNVVQALERNPGLEHFILGDFLLFCAQNGMSLPPLDVAPEGLSRSLASLNMVADQNEEATIILWDTIRRRIRAGMLNSLEKMPMIDRSNLRTAVGRDTIRKRMQYFELLMAIFPSSHVLNMYGNLRKSQIKRACDGTKKKGSVSWADKADVSKTSLAGELSFLVENSIHMLREDLFAFSRIKEEGNDAVNIIDYIHLVYFEIIYQSLEKLLLVLESRLAAGDADLRSAGFSKGNGTYISENNGIDIPCHEATGMAACAFSTMLKWEKQVERILEEQNNGWHTLKELEDFASPRASASEQRKNTAESALNDLIWSELKGSQDSGQGGRMQAEQRWSWREAFSSIAIKLGRTVSSYLMEVLAKHCFEVETRESDWPLLTVTDELYYADDSCPRRICKSVGIFTSVVDSFLPLASKEGGIYFQEVQNIFIETLISCINQYYSHVSEVVSSFPQSTSLSNLYGCLASLSFLSVRLSRYEEVTGINKRKPLGHLIKLFEELVESTKKIIIAHHMKTLISSIFHDAHSHNWEDSKAFFEGERISFSVQMWNFYMRCTWNDLKETISPVDATRILVDLLNESLTFFVSRYSQARPSFNRMPQFRADIIFLATVYTSFSWALSSSNQDFFFRKPDHTHNLVQWQSLCSLLLSFMVLIGAPLRQIVDRFLEDSGSSEARMPASRMWLIQCLPNLFNRSCIRFQDMEDKQAVFVTFKLLTSRPVPHWPLLIQVLMMRHGFLPRLLANHLDKLEEVEKSWLKVEESLALSKNFSDTKVENFVPLQGEKFLRQVFCVLNTSAKSTATAHFLLTLADREDKWSPFEQLVEPTDRPETKDPFWLELVKETLMPMLARILEVPLSMLCARDKEELSPSFTFTAMTTLPCGCATTPLPKGNVTQNVGGLLFRCLKTTLELLVCHLGLVPPSLCMFFGKLNDYLAQRHFGGAATSPGLKTIAYLLYTWISKETNVQSVANVSLTPRTSLNIRSFALLLWHTLHNFSVDVSQLSSISMEIHSHLQSNSAWVLQKLETLKEGLSSSDVTQRDELDELKDQMAEPLYKAMCIRAFKSREGKEALHYIYDVLKANQSVIETKLLGGQTKMPFHTLEGIFTKQSDPYTFNPLLEYRKCGDYVFNAEVLLEQDYDWEQWLNFKFDLDPGLLQRLLFGRCEFLEDNYSSLTSEEKKAVESCRALHLMAESRAESVSPAMDV